MMNGNMKNNNDEYYTPKYIFDAIGLRFDMDVAAPIDRTFLSVPADRFLTENGLELEWNGFVWMNPPFSKSNKPLWLNKIADHNNGIGLTPDRTSAPWWPIAARQAKCLLFITGKVKFVKPDGTIGGQPSNGTTLFAYGEQGIEGLANAERNGLGILLYKKYR